MLFKSFSPRPIKVYFSLLSMIVPWIEIHIFLCCEFLFPPLGQIKIYYYSVRNAGLWQNLEHFSGWLLFSFNKITHTDDKTLLSKGRKKEMILKNFSISIPRPIINSYISPNFFAIQTLSQWLRREIFTINATNIQANYICKNILNFSFCICFAYAFIASTSQAEKSHELF